MALAKALTRKGERVAVGVPAPRKYRNAVDAVGRLADVSTSEEAIARSNFVILAVPYGVASGIARSIPDWRRKLLVDATNPLAPDPSGLTVGTITSDAE
jgi:hypothetical protein